MKDWCLEHKTFITDCEEHGVFSCPRGEIPIQTGSSTYHDSFDEPNGANFMTKVRGSTIVGPGHIINVIKNKMVQGVDQEWEDAAIRCIEYLQNIELRAHEVFNRPGDGILPKTTRDAASYIIHGSL